MSLLPGTPIGKYVVRRKLAEGGMAEIYLCSVLGPEGFEKEVVIKRVRPALGDDPEFVQMFISEARLASKLNHANIVQIFDFDKHENTYYLAMEYVRGKSLWELRKRCKELMRPIPPALAARIGMEVARGLHYAHGLREKGHRVHLVHRDVTPHNILIAYDGSVKLTDFGIAKAGNRLTASGMLKGKFAYMAPEQARGEPVDARTDVFALGIVLWELVTGGRLFEGDSDIAVLRAVQESAIAPPARINPDVDATLDAAIMKALARAPSERYQSAQELEQTLAHYFYASYKSLADSDLAAFIRGAFSEGPSADTTFSGTSSRSAPSPSPVPSPVAAPSPKSPAPAPIEHTLLLDAPEAPDEDALAATVAKPRPLGATVEAAGLGSAPTLPTQRPGDGALRSAAWKVGGLIAISLVALLVVRMVHRRGPVAAPPSNVAARGSVAAPQTPAEMLPRPPGTAVPHVGAAAEVSSLHLQPTAAAAKTAASAQEAVRPEKPDAGVAPTTVGAPPTEVKYGYVVLKAQPWAKVVIDGRALRDEVEGQKRLRLPAGRHRIQLSNNATSEERRVIVDPDHPLTLELGAPSPH